MKNAIIVFLLVLFGSTAAQSKSVAQKRAEQMGLGMNLSYLDNFWNGTKEKHFADFVKANELEKRKQMLADIAKAGFRTVRVPVCFSAWASLKAPYDWENKEGLKAADKMIEWALDNNLNVIVDLHHSEFDGTFPGAASTERLTALWKNVAARYKNTNPERVFFELRNEPHDIKADEWRAQAEQLIKTVRQIAPTHTLIVGFHDWNSRAALVDSKPFADENIIYTFHYYDPFIFTHQGATWSSKGLAEMKGVPFPFDEKRPIKTPDAVKGKWEEGLIRNYRIDSSAEKIFTDLKAAKDWSVKNNVPIFLGEFGSFSKYAAPDDRCRHAKVIYSALGKLNIPSAWWEWDGGFNMFEAGTTKIMNCMQDAINSYSEAKAVK